ncbi:MAG: S8 family serine peptidase [Micromonosporaceae bacterium]
MRYRAGRWHATTARRGTRIRRLAGLVVLCGLLGTAGLAAAPPGYAGQPSTAPAKRCQGDKPEGMPDIKTPPPEQEMLSMEKAWGLSTGKGVTVAVLSSGVDVTHPQLAGSNIGTGADFMTSGNGRYDCFGHGTGYASLIGARPVKGVAFKGLAYDAKILPIVVSAEHDPQKDLDNVTTPAKFAQAVRWAVDKGGAKVIAIPVTVPDDPAVKSAIAHAIAKDAVVVATVGNQAQPAKKGKEWVEVGRSPHTSYPASYDGVIGVSAIAPSKDGHYPPLPTSQWGNYVDLTAPTTVLACALTKGHIGLLGTSPASAFVAGAAALVRSRWPEMSAEEVHLRLLATASPAAGSFARTGYGIVNPYRAVTEELSGEAPVKPVGASPAPPDEATVKRLAREKFNGTASMVALFGGLALAALALSTLTLLPRGRRRRWRPGRAKSFPTPPEDDMPPAPLKLFEDLEPK